MADYSKTERDIAYKVLYECFEKGAFSNLSLKGQDVTDFVTAAVYGTITMSYSLDYIIKQASGKDVSKMDGRTRTILRLGCWQLICSTKVPAYAAVDSSVNLAKKYAKNSSGLVNAVLHRVSEMDDKAKNLEVYKPEIALSLKPEIFGIFKKDYGKERAVSIGKALLNSSGTTIRYDSSYSKDQITADLRANGIEVEESSFMDNCLKVVSFGSVAIGDSKAFKEGKIIVQGESAMLASVVANPQKNTRILDCCAAPGGKTTHLAQLTNDEAMIDALDINENRVELIKQNAKRLGIKSINAMKGDASTFGSNKAQYDLVTADVPCSGLGLLAKKPDIRLQITYDRIQDLLPVQKKILDNAARNVVPGGTLIYSTCTINKAENENQVEEFLSRHEDFYSEDITPFLPERLILGDREELAKKGMITLFPDTDKCDGFFIARLRRRE